MSNNRAAAFRSFSRSIGNASPPRIFHAMLRSSNTTTPPRSRNHGPPRRSPIYRQPRFNNNNRPSSRSNAAKKIQTLLRGWFARQKHLPKNKSLVVINPNGEILLGVKNTRLGKEAAKKVAERKNRQRRLNYFR